MSYSLKYPVSGMSVTSISEMLQSGSEERQIGDKTVSVIERSDGGITAYFKDGRAYSVRLKSPFDGEVRGVRIGDDKHKVLSILGQPRRVWPVHDGTDRWFYDAQSFMRVDFVAGGDVIEFIYV